MMCKSGIAMASTSSVMVSKVAAHYSSWLLLPTSLRPFPTLAAHHRTGLLPPNRCDGYCSHGQRWFTSSNRPTTTLSRTERRALERKEKRRQRRQTTPTNSHSNTNSNTMNSTTPTSASSQSLNKGQFQLLTIRLAQRLQQSMYPRVWENGQQFRQEHLSALLYRLPIALALGYLLTDTDMDCSPYTIQPSLGPSMLPTIQFIGDVWLVETGAWSRRLGIPLHYQQGDVVLWKDPTTGRVSCKRIIGLPGDSVQRYGEYAQIYQHDQDSMYGIVWPKQQHPSNELDNTDTTTAWDATPNNTQIDRQYTIPENHVWLEGDCPPFSLDSRHYGPIPMSWIRGRLLLRLWPWTDDFYLENVPSRQSQWMRNNARPVPFASKQDYLGKRFNFYRISSSSSQDNSNATME